MILLLVFTLLIISAVCFAENKVQYGANYWVRDGHGNFRAVVEVSDASDYNKVRIYWRRHDKYPQNNSLVIEDCKGNRVTEFYVKKINRLYCDLFFKPINGTGEYFVYYKPFIQAMENCEPENPYFREYNIGPTELKDNLFKDYPIATHTKLEYREVPLAKGYNNIFPMEIIASEEEIATMREKYTDSVLIFCEDRYNSIRMEDYIPYIWTEKGPCNNFSFTGQPGEYVVFQIGIYSPDQNLKNVKLYKNDFCGNNTFDTLTCFNLEGTSYKGEYFTKTVNIEEGKVKALWCGVDIPQDATGEYFTTLTLKFDNYKNITINLNLNVQGEVLKDKGFDDMNKLSRLAWLNDASDIEDIVLPPYIPVEVSDNTTKILDREITLGENALPTSIKSRGVEILSRPVEFNIDSITNNVSAPCKEEKVGKSFATFTSELKGDFEEKITSTIECEGFVTFKINLKANCDINVKDINLQVPINKNVAEYLIGYGEQGGYRQGDIEWKWNENKQDHRIWMGCVHAGIQLDLRDNIDTWGQYYNYHFGSPKSWDNKGKGGANVTENENEVLIYAYSGKRNFKKGDEIEFNFRFIITPFHKLIDNHWDYSYTYSGKQKSAHYSHQHHADPGYQHINYPFYDMEGMKKNFHNYHKDFKGINLYYTLRELTTYIPEIFAFESLDYEIFENAAEIRGKQKDIFLTLYGGVGAWVREHLYIDPHPEWRATCLEGEVDPAIATHGLSRMANFYIKGLDYLLDHLDFDGIYIDSVNYDRFVMKRLASVLYKKLGYYRINLHTYNFHDHFDSKGSPSVQYLEHLAYMTTIWFGEEANYDRCPAHWLVENSGILFGLTSEMLHFSNNPNQYRGMIYGMGSRTAKNANELWDFWYDYDLGSTKMIGYWDDCPVKTDCENVLASCFTREGQTLISLASWSNKEEYVTLNIDFEKLGIDKNNATFIAPFIKDFQDETIFDLNKPIKIEPAKGYLIDLKNK